MATTYIRYPNSSSTIPTYANFAALPALALDGSLAVTLDTDNLYVFNLGSSTWLAVGGPGAVLGVGTINTGTPNANGAQIVSNNLVLQYATASVPGYVSITTQTFAGNKTFTGTIGASNFSGTSSGTNTGDQTITLTGDVTGSGTGSFATTIGANKVANSQLAQMAANSIKGNNTGGSANALDLTVAQVNTMLGTVGSIGTFDGQAGAANGLTLTGGSIYAQSASASVPGMVNLAAQAFAGKKTFNAGLDANSNTITNVADPSGAQDAATKNYVDTVASGLNPKQATYAGSTANIVGSYNNGAAGVGAFFTVTATGAFTIDGTTPPAGSRILLKDQTNGFERGVYDLTVAGTTGISPILTRSLDYNTATDMNAGDLIPVINGTVNQKTSWLQTATIATVGSDSLTFVEWTYNPANFLLNSNNLSDVSSKSASFNNLSPMTTLGDIIYGGASGAGTRLAGDTSNTRKFLRELSVAGAATAPVWDTLAAGDIPNLPASIITSGTLAKAQGGTAQDNTSLTFPSTGTVQATTPNNHGVIVSGSGATATVVAPDSSTTKVLVSGGSSADPSWAAVPQVVGIASYSSGHTLNGTDQSVYGDATSAAFTFTLPAASSNVGRRYYIKKTDSSANAITVLRAGSDTIQDAAASLTSTTLNSQGEWIIIECDTSSTWQIQNRRSTFPAANLTWSFNGFTTSATKVASWRQGNLLYVQGQAITSDAAATTASIGLPTGYTIDTTALPANSNGFIMGYVASAPDTQATLGSQNGGLVLFYDGSDTAKLFLTNRGGATAGTLSKINGSAILSAGAVGEITFFFTVPISGWN